MYVQLSRKSKTEKKTENNQNKNFTTKKSTK